MKKLIVLLMIISLIGLCACSGHVDVDFTVDTNPSDATTDPVNETLPDWELPVDVDDNFTTEPEETTDTSDPEQESENPTDATQKPTDATQAPTEKETDPPTTVAPTEESTEAPTQAPTEAPVHAGSPSGGIELPWISG